MFIYVFSKQDKTRLLDAGYILMKSDEFGSVYIFLLEEKANLKELEILDMYFISDVLTF